MKRPLIFALCLIGFSAMIGQIVLMRELMVVFYGNELSLGAMLAAWLFWTAIGSGLFGRLADLLRNRTRALVLCQAAVVFLLPATLFAVRNLRHLLNVGPGEIIGLVPMLYASFAVLGPVCALSGFLFALGCRVYAERYARSARGIGHVYVLESVGASVGGLLCNFLLIRVMSPFEIVFLVGLLNLGAGSALLISTRGRAIGGLRVGVGALLLATIAGFVFGLVGGLEMLSARLQWRGLELVRSVNSIYGNIAVTRSDAQHSFFENGLLMFTTHHVLPAEEAVHFPLLAHPRPREVLLIGGGISGGAAEALKHPIRDLDYVELDPKLIETAREVLADSLLLPLEDQRLDVHHTDGRLFIKQVQRRYDVVIVMLPDPLTAMINRFYTLEFFREVKARLAPEGILSFGVTTSENYISTELRQFLACLRATLVAVFDNVEILPGSQAYFLASDAPLRHDHRVFLERLKQRDISVRYVSEYYLPYTLSEERVRYMKERVGGLGSARINRDFAPIGYFYDMVLWSTYFRPQTRVRLAALLSNLHWGWMLAPVGGILVAGLLLLLKWPSLHKLPVVLAVATTGFSEILFQVVVIVAFQVLYGYVYFKLGLILTSFMIGLVGGGWLVSHVMERLKNDRITYIKTQVAICVYPLFLLGVLYGLAHLGKAASTLGIATAFSFLPIVAGFIGGFQFPLASKICLRDAGQVGRVAGMLYGVDLLGSCLGALVASAVLIPVLGIAQTCALAALLNGVVLVLLWVSRTSTNA